MTESQNDPKQSTGQRVREGVMQVVNEEWKVLKMAEKC